MTPSECLTPVSQTSTHYQCIAPMHIASPGIALEYDRAVEYCNLLQIGNVSRAKLPTVEDFSHIHCNHSSLVVDSCYLCWTLYAKGTNVNDKFGKVVIVSNAFVTYNVPKHHPYFVFPLLDIPITGVQDKK